MSENNFNTSNPETANHHWFPFLRYQQQCIQEGKEASITEWLRSTGKLEHQFEYEAAKAKAATKNAEEPKSKS